MDLKTATASDVSGFWTNEKHVNFLNSMEASFVRRMLENDGRSVLVHDTRLPLDRYLPDSSESTRDLQSQRNRRKRASFSGNRRNPVCVYSNIWIFVFLIFVWRFTEGFRYDAPVGCDHRGQMNEGVMWVRIMVPWELPSGSDVDDDVITEKNTRRRPSQPYDVSEDQVVPQVENIKGEKGGVSGELEVAVVVATEEESCRKAK